MASSTFAGAKTLQHDPVGNVIPWSGLDLSIITRLARLAPRRAAAYGFAMQTGGT